MNARMGIRLRQPFGKGREARESALIVHVPPAAAVRDMSLSDRNGAFSNRAGARHRPIYPQNSEHRVRYT